jgi:hypothetical protein
MAATIQQKPITADDIANVIRSIRLLPVHPEVPGALQRLRNAGFRLVTLTNSTKEVVEAQIREAGLSQVFERTFSVDAIRRFKPASLLSRQRTPGCPILRTAPFRAKGGRPQNPEASWVFSCVPSGNIQLRRNPASSRELRSGDDRCAPLGPDGRASCGMPGRFRPTAGHRLVSTYTAAGHHGTSLCRKSLHRYSLVCLHLRRRSLGRRGNTNNTN